MLHIFGYTSPISIAEETERVKDVIEIILISISKVGRKDCGVHSKDYCVSAGADRSSQSRMEFLCPKVAICMPRNQNQVYGIHERRV